MIKNRTQVLAAIAVELRRDIAAEEKMLLRVHSPNGVSTYEYNKCHTRGMQARARARYINQYYAAGFLEACGLEAS